jgi:hypothetical protein
LAQGDQASQLWKSLTWAKTASGGAAIVIERETANSLDCIAMMTQRIAMRTFG